MFLLTQFLTRPCGLAATNDICRFSVLAELLLNPRVPFTPKWLTRFLDAMPMIVMNRECSGPVQGRSTGVIYLLSLVLFRPPGSKLPSYVLHHYHPKRKRSNKKSTSHLSTGRSYMPSHSSGRMDRNITKLHIPQCHASRLFSFSLKVADIHNQSTSKV